ncbi:unnamed protein product [Closterium sp. NIES-54]
MHWKDYSHPNLEPRYIGKAHPDNGVYFLDFDIPDCRADSEDLIDLQPQDAVWPHEITHPDGRPWVKHHAHPREIETAMGQQSKEQTQEPQASSLLCHATREAPGGDRKPAGGGSTGYLQETTHRGRPVSPKPAPTAPAPPGPAPPTTVSPALGSPAPTPAAPPARAAPVPLVRAPPGPAALVPPAAPAPARPAPAAPVPPRRAPLGPAPPVPPIALAPVPQAPTHAAPPAPAAPL